VSGGLSTLAGILIMENPRLVVGGLTGILGLFFFWEGAQGLWAHFPPHRSKHGWWQCGRGAFNIVLAIMLVTGWPFAGHLLVGLIVGAHLLSTGATLLFGPVTLPVAHPEELSRHPDGRLGLGEHPEFSKIRDAIDLQEAARRRIDTQWFCVFLLTFFAIHVGRMDVPWNLVGFLAPAVAAAGDVWFAYLLAFVVLLPARLAWRRMTRPLERRVWNGILAREENERGIGWLGWVRSAWLIPRFRFSRRADGMRESPRAALRWGLRVGLPFTAILIALNPIWGFSWFFNTENWATGVWNRWAEVRTDTWREAMIDAVETKYASHPARDRLFEVEPEGVKGVEDFSFLVIGDSGEGDASQHCLRDGYLFLGKRPDVKFLVVSSDVIYPAGEMKDYEPNFYLPFKGFTKPIYAIPGNHDWYDALEAFSANFMEEDAARACMLARVETDGRLTTTTESRITGYIDEAARLRREFGVSTGWQRGPFFEIQADRFAFLAIDTGVLAQVDSRQMEWLKEALARSKGKFIMALLGHPFYAGGRDHVVPGSGFEALHDLLREHDVQVVMAGDTHYLEYYREPRPAGKQPIHHFVNGGGGAYISIGTPLDWPAKPAQRDCAFFPRTDFVVNKLDSQMSPWKMPLWLWVKQLRAWPATPEFAAGAFDYDRAPYFQSFGEIRVEGSRNQVRLIPHGANGPILWRDMEVFGEVIPAGKRGEDGVEWVIGMPGGTK